MDAAFSSLDFPGLDWGGYSREEVLDLLTEAALDSLDGTGADFAADQPTTPPDPTAFFALAERDGAAAALAAWEEARFYSPDQPRDDRGRWSSTGGGGGGPAGHVFGAMRRLEKDADTGATVHVPDLRRELASALPGKAFDQALLSLAESGAVDLHRHLSWNAPLTPAQQEALVADAEGNRYIGVARRTDAPAPADTGEAADPFRGGMAHAARAELRTASAAHVRDFVAKGGPATGEEVAALGNHLARLTVAQLHDLRREHGLPAAGAWRMRRPDLVNVLAERFTAHRAGTPTRAARELAAAAAGGAFTASKYAPGDSTHAVEHGRTGFTVSAHPDGRFHVWDSGLAHQGAHDTAAAAVAHAANPPAKPSPDYQPRTADVETAARQGAVADAAARREGVAATHPSGLVPEVVAQHQAPYKGATLDNSHAQEKAGFPKALETLRSWPTDKLQAERRDLVRASFGGMFGQNARKLLAVVEQVIQERRSLESSAPAAGGGAGQTVHVYSDLAGNRTYKLGGKVIPKAKAEELLRGSATRQAHFADAADEPPAERPVRFVPFVQPAAAGGARA